MYIQNISTGRHGGALVKASHWLSYPTGSRRIREHIQLDKSRMRSDPCPIDSECKCYTCRNFSKSYIHHLFKAKEILGSTLVTIHNIHFMNTLMSDIRNGIANDNLDDIERIYVHPELMNSDVDHDGIGK
jgi:queuine tRNA-ribosyltransferase